MGRPGADLLLAEPQSDFLLGGLDRIRAVADVAADVNAEVAADGAGLRVEGLGGAKHLAASGHGVGTLPDLQ